LVDAERAYLRIERLRSLVAQLEEVRDLGEAAYFADQALGREGLLEEDLADRLAQAAKQRNVLVHLYLDVDDRKVFDSLSRLDDLRRFAAFVEEQLD